MSKALSILLLFSAPVAIQAQQRVLGLDISAWQGNISQTTWNNIHNVEGRDFIILRSSRGGTTGYYNQNDSDNSDGLNTLSQRYDDPYYIQNINRVTAAGMYAGSYHFSRPDIITNTFNAGGIANSGTDEADHFIQMAGPWMRPGYLVPVHDFEAGAGLRSNNEMAQFNLEFSDRIYEVMKIRPAIYTSGSYASILQNASLSNRNRLAQPAANLPSVVSPAYPTLWSARWPNQQNPSSIDVQTGEPKDSYAAIYGPWDDYGTTHPWKFWQYASTMRLQSFNNGGSNLDVDVVRGGIEFLEDQLIPAVWWHDFSGDWSTLANWNSGQAPVMPVPGPGQVAPVGTLTLPTPRLPGAAGSGVTSGQHDTVILERPNADVTVTLSTGTHNVRKFYMRETLNITGGSLNINYVPSPDSTPHGAQFSGPVTLSGTGSLSVHTLQVDASQTFTLGGGTLAFDTISLMPDSATPAKIAVTGSIAINPLLSTAAVVENGVGSGSSGFVDLGGDNRSIHVGDGSSEVDLSINVPVSNGGMIKAGSGTIRLREANTYNGGTTISGGKLLVNNTSGSGTGNGSVIVNNGTVLAGTGTINGPVTVNAGGTLSAGTASSIGTLTLGGALTLNGTTLLRIDRNDGDSRADKLVRSSGTLAYGGTLVVSNVGAALVGGETFTNFAAGSYSGSFATTNLPNLNSGLNWYLGNLTVNGTIKVNRKPGVSGAAFSNTPGQVLQIPKASLVNSATDADNDSLALASFDAVTSNGISLTSDSTFIYYSNNLNVADEFNYTISDGRGGFETGVAEITVNLFTAPSIASGPENATVVAGQNATFTVVASGTQPLAYQWKFNGGNISGATGSTCTRANAQPADAGTYTVTVSNSYGSITSAPATLTINYSLNASTTSGGTVSKTPDQTSYASNAVVTLTATPDAGFTFSGWSGDASGATNPLNVTMTTNKSVTANFTASSTDLILDNVDSAVTFAGDWQSGTASSDKYGVDYRFAVTSAGGETNVVYRPLINTSGYYNVYIFYPQGANRATNAPWSIFHQSGSTNVFVNQSTNGGSWVLIAASQPFLSGTNGYVSLSNNSQAGKVVLADAVRFVYIAPLFVAPEITSHPSSQTNSAGSTVVFSVTATGSEPLSYQWKKGTNTLFDGGNISGATAASFTLTSISQTDAGNYSVTVSNEAGTISSLPATLTVIDSPVITSQPSSLTRGAGSNAVFTVTAGGENLSYSWRKNNSPLPNGGNVSGATSASLTLLQVSASDEGSYTVVVQNSAGSVTSAPPATLTVIDPPSITAQPASRTNLAATVATFSVAATGSTPLGYQWRQGGTNLSDGGTISGATSATLTLENVFAADSGTYDVVVSNGAGSIFSEPATLTVIDPVIIEHPIGQNIPQGNTATFSVEARGTTSLGYQWRKNNLPLSDGGNVSGATTTNLILTSVSFSDVASYSVIVSNGVGSITSSAAALTIPTDDFNKPTLTFTLPTRTQTAVIKLKGTAKDTAPGVVSQVWYRLEPATEFSPANLSGTSAKTLWESPEVTLRPGTNIVHAYAVDSAGNHSQTTNSKTFYYDLTDFLTVNIIGGGEVKKPDGTLVGNGQQIPLLVGRPSSLTAFIRPRTLATNYVFSNWFGAVTSDAAKLNFVMQTNMTLTAQFIPNPFVPVAGKYHGLFFETNGIATHQTAGFITFNLTSKASYSGRVMLDGNVLSISGKFNLSGRASKTISRAKFGKSTLNLDLALDWSTTSQKVFGTIGDGAWSSETEADRSTFNPANPAIGFVGRYTMLIPRTNYPATSPGGFGYGLITNNLNGKIALSGRTGDGAVLAQSVQISKDGRWPFYVPLYRNTNSVNGFLNKSDYRGSLLGWIHFNTLDGAPTGTVSWIKNAVPMSDDFNVNYFYPAGFTNLMDILSSPFQAPPTGTPLFPFPAARLLVANGNLPGAMMWNASVNANNVVKVSYAGTDKVTVTLNAKTGLMKGTFLHPNNGSVTTTFWGAVLQNQNYAAGEFLGRTDLNGPTNQTGSVIFEGN